MSQATTDQFALAEQVYRRMVNLGVIPTNGNNAPTTEKMSMPAARQLREGNSEEAKHAEEQRKKEWEGRRKANFDEGDKNRRYYIDTSTKAGIPWHHAVKGPHQYSEFVLLTPEMAKVLLDHNPRNRTIKTSSLDAYKRDILADRWLQTDEAIGVDTNGDLYNGQHRCTAVFQTGKAVVFYFTFNVPLEAKFVVDSGCKRSTAEKLGYIIDHTLSTRLAAIARSMMRGTNPSKVKHSDSEIAAFATKYQEIIEWASKSMPKVRSDVQAAVAKYALRFSKDAIMPFCNRFHTLQFHSPNDPAATLYKFLAKSRGEPGIVVYRKALAALEHALANRDIRNLHEREDDILEFDEQWNVVGQ